MKALDEESYSWYLLFTVPFTEQKVKKQLDEAGVENFLPLQTSRLLWQNKEKKRCVPVIPRSIFVRFSLANREQLSAIPSLLLPADVSSCRLTEEQMQNVRILIRDGRLSADWLCQK